MKSLATEIIHDVKKKVTLWKVVAIVSIVITVGEFLVIVL